MKVLDLFCGCWGWSKPFIETGHDVTGVDSEEWCDPPAGAKFIKANLEDWVPDEHYDVILASPPCTEFSIIKKDTAMYPYDERIGLDLVWRAFYIIQKVKPKYWVLENVKGLSEFLGPPREVVRYGKKKGRKEAYLYGNFPSLPMFSTQIHHGNVGKMTGYGKAKAKRAEIPRALSESIHGVICRD